MTTHNLEKTGKQWHCSVCLKNWSNKPRSGCLGLPIRDWGSVAPDEITSLEIDKMMLQLKEGTKAIGVRTAQKERIIDWIYKRENVVPHATEPPVISWEDKEANGYLTIYEMNEALVRPFPNADTKRLPLWDKVDKEWDYIIAVNGSECEPCNKPNFLTKSQAIKELKINPEDKGLPPAQVSYWRKKKRQIIEIKYYDRRMLEETGF